MAGWQAEHKRTIFNELTVIYTHHKLSIVLQVHSNRTELQAPTADH